eukprot:CAMPEP_0202866474 /NCGR_PEP_ID=MMETSP1391-20130828/7641_1 /ASSEMBLY_ACC=CAM_ASM_000867 /TAXON_ID=1034604 /ORGANISM="Chlamydomonas leiostraca, Strain SAG 11-49" /LENGTH=422 /DNA_ID=CAMNT_0049546423 /DNA_START=98 /DNA_END=1367 /DNA_ORIENTATION=+
MTRITHTPGGGSSIAGGIFGTDRPPASPQAAPPAPIVAAALPPVEAPVVEPIKGAITEESKLKAIALLAKLQEAFITPELAADLSALNEKLESALKTQEREVVGDSALANLRAALKLRGTHGIISLGKKFKSMDDDSSKQLCFEEFKKGLTEMNISESDTHRLFRAFDSDCSGYLSYDEFLVGLRGELPARRLDMVQRAYKVLDKTGDGQVTMEDIKGRYNGKMHPDVILKIKTEEEVLAEFMSVFEAQGGGAKGDGVITLEEFKKYYASVSASIDLDDYFELVIRNAWHISGGEGWCANTTCKRVLVLHEDGAQTVQEVKDDFDVQPEQYLERLKAQGVTGIKSVALYGEPSDVPAAKPAEAAPPPSPSAGTPSRPGTASTGANNKAAAMRSSIIFGEALPAWHTQDWPAAMHLPDVRGGR